MILITVLLMFIPTILLSQTVQFLIPPTTFQVLLEDIDKIENEEDRIVEIGKELEKNPDVITGQSLLNYKTYLEIGIKHTRQKRNYIGFINYPVYIKEE